MSTTTEPEPGAGSPASLRRIRINLCVFIVLAVFGLVSGAAPWITLTIALACLAIPAAVAVQDGADAVRALLLIPTRNDPQG